MKTKINRRVFLKKISFKFSAIIATCMGSYGYSRFIEPRFLEKSHHEVSLEGLPQGFNRLKIAVFSDTHLGFQFNLNQFAKMARDLSEMHPDIIVFAGDLVDDLQSFSNMGRLEEILSELKAPFGKFAVYGNHDHGGYGSSVYKQALTKVGFTLLRNQSVPVDLLDGSRIWIAGIDEPMLGRPDIGATLKDIPNHSFAILLSHAPDLADEAAKKGINLQISGHSHGGQIQLPFIGPLITPPYAKKYYEGFYSIGKMHLFVSRGIGTTRLPFRFLSRPEISLLTLKSSGK
ncbi:metallophosphoesterase [Bacillus massilinigeriensis]|uniref:metallophosphoesterase n=1 Tax=Bacillus mediterraneensis TaxID=1805474 RepID=UPI000A9FDF05|nr:metallophosphoesterase [Bacillus mediterraneensis]